MHAIDLPTGTSVRIVGSIVVDVACRLVANVVFAYLDSMHSAESQLTVVYLVLKKCC